LHIASQLLAAAAGRLRGEAPADTEFTVAELVDAFLFPNRW